MPLSILVSQIGYRPEDPKVAVIRGAVTDDPPAHVLVRHAGDGEVVARPTPITSTALWGSRFWTAELTDVREPGRYVVQLPDGQTSNAFDIEDDILLRRTLHATSVETLEARVRGKLGWQDCAFDGRGLESHAVVVLGLVDVQDALVIDAPTRKRLRAQLHHGADYLLACQRPDGSLMNEHYIARDKTTWTLCALACLAMARSAEHLASGPLLDGAKAAWAWCTTHDSWQDKLTELDTTRRIFGQYAPWTPPDAPRARDLLLLLRCATELYRNTNDPTYLEAATHYAGTLHASYQCLAPSTEHQLYGDFFAWPESGIHQRAWEHAGWGYNCGAVLPDDVSGLLSLLEVLPEHPDAPLWRATLHHYTYGHLVPACGLSPFGIYPMGNCEGEVFFFGPSWHGFNGMYAQVARAAMLLARHFRDPDLERLAQRNLQWIAGANAGIDDGDGRFHGLSWISGIGDRSVTVLSRIPGSIGNGLCASRQFRLRHLDDLTDAPAFATTEDWLVHNGSWLSGLAEVSTRPRIKVKAQDRGVPVRAHVVVTLGTETFETTTNARGVAIFEDLPRLRAGSVEVAADGRRIAIPVRPVSGHSLDMVVDLSETLRVEWEQDEDDQPHLLITNLGDQPTTAQVAVTAVTDSVASATTSCELLPGEPTIQGLSFDLTSSPTSPYWLRAVVTGKVTVTEVEKIDLPHSEISTDREPAP